MEGWMLMENAGCVFLPAAGSRYQTTVFMTGPVAGYYWSNSNIAGNTATNIAITPSSLSQVNSTRYSGYAVRLVRDVE